MSTLVARDEARAPDGTPAARLGMWVFIASEVLFFGGLLFAYAAARSTHAHAFAMASRHTEIVIGTANTALLLTSSAAVALASEAASARAWRLTRVALWAAIMLGATFLLLKSVEYGLDWRHGLIPGPGFRLDGPASDRSGAEVFFSLYFLMTSLHALHMLVGLGLLAWLTRQLGRRDAASIVRHAHVTALYWHFVDVIWIVLYPLLYLVDRS